MTDTQALTTDTPSAKAGGLGRISIDPRVQETLGRTKDAALGYYGQAMDRLDGLVERVPAGMQGRARSTLAVARQRPLLTTLAVAGLGLLLAGAARRR